MIPLGQRFYPSECAFPLRECFLPLQRGGRGKKRNVADESCLMPSATRYIGHVANLLVRFALASDKVVPAGWAPRTLIQCGVAYPEIWDILHGMYESQVAFHSSPLPPPFLSFSFVSFLGVGPRPSVKYQIRS